VTSAPGLASLRPGCVVLPERTQFLFPPHDQPGEQYTPSEQHTVPAGAQPNPPPLSEQHSPPAAQVACPPQHVAPGAAHVESGQQVEPLVQQLPPHIVPEHVAAPPLHAPKLVAQLPFAQHTGVAAGQVWPSPQQVSPSAMHAPSQQPSPMLQQLLPHCGCPMKHGTAGGQSLCDAPQKPPPQQMGVLEPQQPLGPQPGPAEPGPTHSPHRLSFGSQQMPFFTVWPVGQHWLFAAHC
jgi:hypothetical protein